MKIIYIYHSISVFGGMERIFTDKMNYLADNTDNKIYFITTDQNNINFSFKLSQNIIYHDLGGIKYHSIYNYSYPARLLQLYRYYKDFKNRINNYIKEIEPDIIINTNDHNAIVIANLKINSIKIIEFHLAKKYSLRAKENQSKYNFSYWIRKIYDYYYCKKLDKYNAIVVLTKNDLKEWGNKDNMYQIPNFCIPYGGNLNNKCKKNTIISVGRLYEQKGFDLLIQAWSKISCKYKNWNIEIYGEGNDRKYLDELINKNNLKDSVSINKPINNIYDKYVASEFFVLSSRYEGFGLVLLEAMSCGIPCVSFDCPNGPSEIITDNIDGILVKNGDVAALSQKIEWMILNEDKRVEMGYKARIKSLEYTPEKIMNEWILLFNNLIVSKNK